MALYKLNFLPPRIREARARQMVQLTMVGVVVGIMAIPVGFWYLKWSKVARLKSEIRQVEIDSREYSGVIDKVKQLETQEASVAKKLNMLKSLTGRQSRWIALLETVGFSQAEAQDVWLTSLVSAEQHAGPDKGKITVTLQGLAFSLASVHEFTRALSQSDLNIEFGTTRWNHTSVAGEKVIMFTTEIKFKV